MTAGARLARLLARHGRHQCPRDGCTRVVSDRKLMCGPDWRLVPPPLRRAVTDAYRHGKGLGTGKLIVAQASAVIAANRAHRLIGGCPWCRPLGSYGDIATLPSQCNCGTVCDATWCQARAVTR